MITQTDKHRIADRTVRDLTPEQCKKILRAYGITHFNKRYLKNQTSLVLVMSPRYWQDDKIVLE